MSEYLNPKLKKGDRIICYHMDGETSVPPGTIGVVKNIGSDPFEDDSEIIEVDWENGSKLALVSSVDAWKKVPNQIVEQDENMNFINNNPDIFLHFDWRWFRVFLTKIRDSGIINMFESSPLLYSGKNFIERYYGEGREDNDEFIAVLEDADESKNKLIQGVISYMSDNNLEIDNLDKVNRFARHFSMKLLNMYIALSNITGNLS